MHIIKKVNHTDGTATLKKFRQVKALQVVGRTKTIRNFSSDAADQIRAEFSKSLYSGHYFQRASAEA